MHDGVSKQNLLLVDADPRSLRVLEVSLKKAGYNVITASNGHAALACMQDQAPDLVLSDTHMPEMDGFELCRQIKEQPSWSKIPFLFLSSRKSIEDKIRGLELGVEDYLNKPVYIKEITTRVRMLLQRQQRERLESQRDTRTKFTGSLADVGIVDLVQTIDVNRKSGIIHIVNEDGRRGAIYFRDGRVIDAEAGRLSGLEAVYRMFSWADGSFEVDFKNVRRRDVIELSAQALLMEGMRRLDEWTRMLEGLPALDTVLQVEYRVLADRLGDIPDEVNHMLRLFDGRRTFQQVIEDSEFSDLEAVSVIARLHRAGIVDSGTARSSSPRPPQSSGAKLERWLNDSASQGSAIHRATTEGHSTARVTTLDASGHVTYHEATSHEDDTERGFAAAAEGSTVAREKRSITSPYGLSTAEEDADSASDDDQVVARVRAPSTVSAQEDDEEENQEEYEEDYQEDFDEESDDAERTPGPTQLLRYSAALARAEEEASDERDQGGEDGAAITRESKAIDPERDDELDDDSVPPHMHGHAAHLASGPDGDAAAHDAEGPDFGQDDDATEAVTVVARSSRALPVKGDGERAGTSLVRAVNDEDPDENEDEEGDEEGDVDDSGEPAAPFPTYRDRMEDMSRADMLDELGVPRGTMVKRLVLGAAVGAGIAFAVILGLRGETSPPAGQLAITGGVESTSEGTVESTAEGIAESAEAAPAEPAAQHQLLGSLPPAQVQPDAVNAVAELPPAELPPAHADLPSADLPPVDLPSVDLPQTGSPPAKALSGTPGASAGEAVAGVEKEEAMTQCQLAHKRGRYKGIVDACGRLLKMDPAQADIMVLLAHAELDEGNLEQALAWAQMAVKLDSTLADAYVFIGSAEQEQGHPAAAKTAYQRYLELAPAGQYARDLRVILLSL